MPTVLVIDDEAALIEMVELLLSKAGFEVETTTSGPEGLLMAFSSQPDVVIVDVMMPEMDGYEVCRRLRGDPRTARSAIIVLTARGQPVDKGMALRSGADLWVTKPFEGKALIRDIQEQLTRRSRGMPSLGYQILTLRLSQGTGATTLAANLSLCLTQEEGRGTVVVDIAQPGGQLAERLALEASVWAEPLVSDTNWVATHLVRHASGLFVLPASKLVLAADQPVPNVMAQLLQVLREWYDYVVLDAPLNLGPTAPSLLGGSPLILLLLTPDMISLQRAEASLAAIRQFGAESSLVWPVLNMVRPQQEAFSQWVEETLGLPVKAVLPWAPEDCEEAIASGCPVVLGRPQSPLATAYQALAEQVGQAANRGLAMAGPVND
jgi:DNA-binding response OmpR family regulator